MTFTSNREINVAIADYERHMADLQKAKEEADILFELLAYGILKVKPELIGD